MQSEVRTMSFGVLAAALLLLSGVQGHPLCLDTSTPSNDNQSQLSFCSQIADFGQNTHGACCDAGQEQSVKAQFFDPYAGNMSDECKSYQSQVACASCSPYAAHLLPSGNAGDTMLMCRWWCDQYVSACADDLGLASDYCDQHASSDYYCYPVNDELIGQDLQPLFPKLTGQFSDQLTGAYTRPDTGDWWILDQRGSIKQVANDPNTDYVKDILNIQYRVNQGGGEMGLLGLAFSPDWASTKRFYIYYIDNSQNSVLARYTYNPDSPDATAGSESVLMTFPQPYQNHNGGDLLFEPGDIANPYNGQDHYDLYVLTGDGGSANDPSNRAQDPWSKYGKVLRLSMSTDVNRGGYDIPGDNMAGEVWAYGLRNPWRCSFDADQLDEPQLWCGDVGQDAVEEVVHVQAGNNYGWRTYEGTRYNGYNDPNLDFHRPELQYCHNEDGGLCPHASFTGECVTGGYWYRGSKQADQYSDSYIFADYQRGQVMRMYQDGDHYSANVIANTGWLISALAQDNDKELYLVKYGTEANIYPVPDASGRRRASSAGGSVTGVAGSNNLITARRTTTTKGTRNRAARVLM